MDASAKTVRNSLKKVGLKGSVKVKKPLLAKRVIQQRLAFCKKYKNWTVEDWQCVIWSNKCKINWMGSDECKWYWKLANSKY